MRRIPLFLSGLPVVLSGPLLATGGSLAHAADSPRLGGLYAELQVGANGVRHSELDFVSPLASASIGTWLYPGIGVEAFVDVELERGADQGFEAGVSRAVGGALRLSSPSQDGLRGYIVLGYVDFTVAQQPTRGESRREIDERFSGARLGIGLQQRLERVPGVLVGAEYRRFFVDEAIHVDGLVLGLRWDVR